MKKHFPFQFLFVISMLLGISAEAGATIYDVSTGEEFVNHWTNNDSIRLVADIDLSNYTASPIYTGDYTAALSGKRYDGKNSYYTISNIKVTLAQNLISAYIHDVRIKDCSVQHLGIPNASGFVLCQHSYNCTFENIVLYNVASDIEPQTLEVGLGKDDASCLVGIDDGSRFSNISAFKCTAYAYNSYAGILCSESTGSTFEDCTIGFGCGVYADGTFDNSYSGGLVGIATNSTFTRCDNMACVIGAMDCVGGIAGKGTMTTFRNCNNYGSVRIGKYGSCAAFRSGVQINRDAMPSSFSSDELERICSNLDVPSRAVVTYYAKLLYDAILYQGECANDWWMDFDRSVFLQQNLNEESIVSNELDAETVNAFEPEIDISDASSMELSPTDFDYNMTPIEAEDGGIVNDLSLSDTEIFNGATENIGSNPITRQANVRLNTYTAVMVGVSIAQAVIEICKTIYNAQNSDDVGGIVGLMYGGGVHECTNYGLVYSADAYGGGIVGDADDKGDNNPIIENCMNRGLVKGYEQTGGIVGRIECGAVNNCLNIGNISTGNSNAETFGRIFGQKDEGVQSNGNLYASNTVGNEKDGCQGVTLKMLASGEAAQLLNKGNSAHVWRQSVGVEYYPSLLLSSDSLRDEDIDTTIDPTIRTKNPSNFLQALACQYSNIVLTDDIDLNTSMFNFSSRYMPFYGSIDGQNHKLKNVSYVTPKPNTAAFSNDNSNTNVGFLSYARNATFKDLELNDFVLRGSGAGADTCALFVANSDNCTYSNIRVTGASSLINKDDVVDEALLHVGCLVGYSHKDTFTDCWTGPMANVRTSGKVLNSDVYAGGLVGVASESNFLRCYNQATVNSCDKIIGGIVGRIESGSIKSCVNMGAVTGYKEVGGIAGEVYTADILQCVNTGTVSRCKSSTEASIGGIAGAAGCRKDATARIDNCANWGKVYASSGAEFTGNGSKGAILGTLMNKEYVLGINYYDFLTGNSNVMTNINCDVKDGSWTYMMDYGLSDNLWYQDIDNNTFPTRMPIPLAAAGRVNRNYNCKQQAAAYSNKYASKALHSPAENKFGVCSICGAIYDAPAGISITSDKDMIDFSYATSNGQNFSASTISLERDLDLSQKSLGSVYAPVGTYNHPFRGKFYGNGHHIRNMHLEDSEEINGFFGCVGGNTEIDDVIIDSTCYVSTAGYGAAGLIGAMTTDGDGGTYMLSINRCGNDANVSAYTNAAGILGGVFAKSDNDQVTVNIDHCYNTGTIKGDKESAAICGYARDQAYIDYSWNSGAVSGYDSGYPFVRYNKNKASAICHLNHCYATTPQTDVNKMTMTDVRTGRLCFLLNRELDGATMTTYQYNTGGNAWYQQIGVNRHPVAQQKSDNLVYHHEYSQCNTPTVVDTLYNNSSEAIAAISHKFNSSGICTRVEGEIHGEEPALVDGTWQITKMGNLYWIASQVNAGGAQHDCLLMNDVRDNSLVEVVGFLNPSHRQFNVWTPIGTEEHPFKKAFDGNFHNISGLYCDKGLDDRTPTGLFGVLQDNMLVNNLGVHDCYFRSYWKVGILAGSVVNVNMSPAFYNINTNGAVLGITGVGGLIGMIQDREFNANSLKNSYSLAYVTREKDPAFNEYDKTNNGALVGTIRTTDATTMYTGELSHCYYLKGINGFTSTYGEEKQLYDFRCGSVCELLNDHQTTAWSQSLGTQYFPDFGKTGITYERTVNTSTWGTVVLPYALSSNNAVQLYKVVSCDATPEATSGNLMLKPVDQVAANTPCFFKKLDDSATSVSFAENPGTFVMAEGDPESVVCPILTDAGWAMVGSYNALSELKGVYYLAQDKLWYAEEPIELPAYRAYLASVNPRRPCKSLSLLVLDEDDEVDEIVNITSDSTEGACYNVAGQRVSPTTRGIVIRGGKKVLNK